MINPVNHQLKSNALITLAGTVGAGKSSLTNVLSEALSFKPAFEKVDGNPYLEDYYHDFKKWSFHLQMYFLAERFKQQKNMHEENTGYVQDRSIYEDVGIFAKLQYDQGNMSDRDFNTYHSLFEAMVMNPYFPKPDVLIFIDGKFESIIDRIHKRGREMEINTPESYWFDLYQRYQHWIHSFTECPILHLDIDYYDCQNQKSVEQIVKALETMMANPEIRYLNLSEHKV
ncbi:deoxynucleoside kinase [Salisediminibacterium beveridgei]|uniref:Deoxyadenosine kinase / Deoxyguanosine kinase n=1 Tax=Salisediminibacterium beveridgei TaxID=632773 RepID=A0A1D7QV77_9BACI|nr:deoxynucleoside kinase [Salisediminibacterium beveridgei]AOM82868.1 Deoxyadenosine kinase / Deoxyguanosine kinase [Salisediminibacterium beveridgei]